MSNPTVDSIVFAQLHGAECQKGVKQCGADAQLATSHSMIATGRHVGIFLRKILAFKPEYKPFIGQD